jgi:TrmH family RNA methyltransferase
MFVNKYMETITSKDNKKIKYIKKLLAFAAYRREEGRFIAEGLRLCGDALLSGADVDTAVFSEAFHNTNAQFVEKVSEKGVECLCVRDSIFSALSDTKTPQGVLFVIKTLDKTLDFDTMKKNGHILALECVQDPTNLGTILRSAEALGIDAVVLSRDCCDIYAPKVIRGSMGAVFRLPFMIADDLPAFVRGFNRRGRSYAAVLDRGSRTVQECDFSGLSLCALGNEGNGLSRELIDACSQKLFIPMAGGAESLNVSAAAAIIIWEMMR